MSKQFDVIIIGGSYAGLSAAMALGRSLRKVLIIDAGNPCNKQTPHAHNFITHDGDTPAQLASLARKQVMAYDSVQFASDEVVDGTGEDGEFKITTSSGDTFQAKKLLFATGLKDTHTVKGFDACWGISVLHCPYCHGYEVRNQTLGVVANGEHAFHMSKLVFNLSKKVTLYTNGQSTLTEEQSKKLATQGISIVEDEILEALHSNGRITHLVFKNGLKALVEALFVKPDIQQHCKVPEKLGCMLNEHGLLQINNFQLTTVPGVYAAGDNSSMMRALSAAIAAGGVAGAMLNKELTDKLFE